MWNLRRKFTIYFLSLGNPLNSATYIIKPTQTTQFLSQCAHLVTASYLRSPLDEPLKLKSSGFPVGFSSFTSLTDRNSSALTIVKPNDEISDDNDDDEGSEDDNDESLNRQSGSRDDEDFLQDIGEIMDILCTPRISCSLVKDNLQHCGVTASTALVVEVLSRVRNDWEAAYTFFLWAGSQPGYAHSLREYHSMFSILGKMRKFGTAWALIDEMRGGKTGPSLVTPHMLLIMIRRYCAEHDLGKAINTFYAHKRFKFEVGMEEFQNLLSAHCRYKNVKDAEHLLLCKKDVFRLNTKSFNLGN